MLERTRAVYGELARALGTEELVADDNGAVRLEVGDGARIMLFGEQDVTLLLVAPVAPLPPATSYATMSWLLKRNFYTSDMAPFRVACDEAGTVVIWGRMPVEGLTGAALANVIDAVAAEARQVGEALEG